MTVNGYGSHLADLAPTQDELDALYDVLDEVDQDEAAAYGDPETELADLGPGYPATSPELAYELDETYGIDLAGDIDPLELIAAEQTARVLDMARQDQDEQDAERAAGPRPRRYSAEERLARALDRIEQGTYTPPAAGYAELSNASGNCGPTDAATGLCAAPFHQLDCTSAHLSSPATGDQDEMDAWRSVVLAHSGREVDASAIDLATRTGPGFDDLLESPEPADSATYYELRKILGISRKPGPVYGRPAPAITRRELGI